MSTFPYTFQGKPRFSVDVGRVKVFGEHVELSLLGPARLRVTHAGLTS